MDARRAHRLLTSGADGIREWNAWQRKTESAGRKQQLKLDGLDFRKHDLADARFNGLVLSGSDFRGATLSAGGLASATLIECDFRGALVKPGDLRAANLSKSDLRAADIQGVRFIKVDLRSADLRGAMFDTLTNFAHCEVSGCRIERHAIEMMSDRGALSNGQLMTMRIEDGVALMRAQFSGFWQWLHLVAVLLFVAPYLWFILSHYPETSPASALDLKAGEVAIPLWLGTLRHVLSGGATVTEWRVSWTFFVFLLALVYNALRVALVWKTKQLELSQDSLGLPVLFTLRDVGVGRESDCVFGGLTWGRLYEWARIGARLNVVLVCLHTAHFFLRVFVVPVGG